jgi:hypothetical protein
MGVTEMLFEVDGAQGGFRLGGDERDIRSS